MTRYCLMLIIAFAFSVAMTSAASAQTQSIVYVDASSGNTAAPSPSNPASTWTGSTGAYKYLQNGLLRATQLLGDLNPPSSVQVWVADGIYYPDEGHDAFGAALAAGDQDLSFNLRDNVKIYGGFKGNEAAGLDGLKLHDPIANVTILSGDLAGDDSANFGNRGDNSYHVVSGVILDDTARLDGFLIRGGNATSFDSTGKGGGMVIDTASALIARCTFMDNSAELSGGAVHGFKAFPQFINCRFLGNRAFNSGGGTHGGAVHVSALTAEFVNCEFVANTAQANGGAIYGDQTDFPDVVVNIRDCTFSDNSANAGGSVHTLGNLTIQNSILWNNAPNAPVGGSTAVTYSNVQGGFTGTGNINSNPLFVDADGVDNDIGTSDDNLRLTCGSPSIDAGSAALLPADAADLDFDASVVDVLPRDLFMRTRVQTTLDQGAHERVVDACITDINSDGVVNVNDLLAVITHWGNCAVPAACPEDVNGPCASDANGVVDVNDLLAVITTWSTTCNGPGIMAHVLPESFNDCLDLCSGLTGEDLEECMEKCLEALCARGYTEFCD